MILNKRCAPTKYKALSRIVWKKLEMDAFTYCEFTFTPLDKNTVSVKVLMRKQIVRNFTGKKRYVIKGCNRFLGIGL